MTGQTLKPPKGGFATSKCFDPEQMKKLDKLADEITEENKINSLNRHIVVCTDTQVEILGPAFLPEDMAGFCGDVKVYMTQDTLDWMDEVVVFVIAGYAKITVVESIKLFSR